MPLWNDFDSAMWCGGVITATTTAEDACVSGRWCRFCFCFYCCWCDPSDSTNGAKQTRSYDTADTGRSGHYCWLTPISRESECVDSDHIGVLVTASCWPACLPVLYVGLRYIYIANSGSKHVQRRTSEAKYWSRQTAIQFGSSEAEGRQRYA